jgi:hypothetical protein
LPLHPSGPEDSPDLSVWRLEFLCIPFGRALDILLSRGDLLFIALQSRTGIDISLERNADVVIARLIKVPIQVKISLSRHENPRRAGSQEFLLVVEPQTCEV